MYTDRPSVPTRSPWSQVLWIAAAVGLVATVVVALVAAAPTDADGVAAEPEPVVDDVDVAAFEQAIEQETRQASDAVRQAEEARIAAEEEAARLAAEEEAARVAAEAEALRATMRHRGTGRSSDGQWAALRNCESSGNYAAVSSTGTYRGAYQFSQATWNSVASAHHPWLIGVDPASASPADQDAQARALYAMSGRGQWPECGRHLS